MPELNNYHLKIMSWAEEDRPREKLVNKGKAVLTDAELLGILLGSGTKNLTAVDLAKQILASVNNDLNKLAKLNVNELQKFNGVGLAKAITIVSALELGRRRNESESSKSEKITSAKDVYQVMRPLLLDLDTEEFWIILLNRSNHIIKKDRISSGGVSGTVVDPKVIFKSAIQNLASSFILIHNHPSGNIQPSQDDIEITRKLSQSGKTLELPVLDHLIFTNDKYFSFADEGLI